MQSINSTILKKKKLKDEENIKRKFQSLSKDLCFIKFTLLICKPCHLNNH